MLGKWVNKGVTAFLFLLLTVFLSVQSAQAAYYDATGPWTVVFTPALPNVPSSAGCLPVHMEQFGVVIAQDGDAFTVQEVGEPLDTGTVNADVYTFSSQQADSSTKAVTFMLADENKGSGSMTATWPDGQGGSCSASGTLELSRAIDGVFDFSGSWNVQVMADLLDTTLSDVSCESGSVKTMQAEVIHTGSSFLIALNGASVVTGAVDGGFFTFHTKPAAGLSGKLSFRLLLTNKNAGSGEVFWSYSDGSKVCSGSNQIALSRVDANRLDPTTTLTVAPMNMTVGNTRILTVDHATGMPIITLQPDSVLSLITTSGINRVTCEAPGEAIVTVTDAVGSATAPIHCVSVDTVSSAFNLADWLFLNDVTLVQNNFWQSNEASSQPENRFNWSRAGGSAPFAGRGVVSTVFGDNVQYYTLDANGLTLHGEQQYDSYKNQVSRMAHYGFVVAPDLNFGPVDIKPEQVAVTNLVPPAPLFPASLSSGDSNAVTLIQYQLDSEDQPVANQWQVVKFESEVMGGINLLDVDLPEELQIDDEFKAWRDSVRDVELLNKLTDVLRIHLVQTRYKPDNSMQVEGGYLYMVRGVGIVYEHWQENEGRSKSSLIAFDVGQGLLSLTDMAMVAKRFRVDAPVGVTLENAFVRLNVEHYTDAFAAMPHHHTLEGNYNETAGSNSALFTVYDRALSLAWDPTDVVKLIYGAVGYERQQLINFSTNELGNPHVLTLGVEQQGRPVTFTVRDKAGTPITNIGIQLFPTVNGVCDQIRGDYQELSSAGSVTVTLTDGAHCVALWPQNSDDFIGGYYDPTVLFGLVNILGANNGQNPPTFMVANDATEFVLIVDHDDIPDYSRMTGVLTDGTTGISNADIFAFPESGGEPLIFHTDATGAFTLDLPVGGYTFWFRHAGNGMVSQAFLTAFGENNALSVTEGVVQGIYTDTLLGQVSLTSAYSVNTVTLSGVITDATTNKIIGGARVWVTPSGSAGTFVQATADGSGVYSLQVPANADYYVRVEAAGNGMLYRGYLDAFGNLVANKSNYSPFSIYGTRTLDMSVTDAMGITAYAITGLVTDKAATPAGIAKVEVRAFDQVTKQVYKAETDAQGNYVLLVPAGSYQVEIFAHDYMGGMTSGSDSSVTLAGISKAQTYLFGGAGGMAALTLNVALAPQAQTGFDPGVEKITITGTVSGSVGPLSNILVEFHPDWEHSTGFVDMASVKTDASGHYSVAIYPGFYRVMFRSEYWDDASSTLVSVAGVLGQGGFSDGFGQAVELEESANLFELISATAVDVTLSGGVQISGKVSSDSGAGVPNVKVEFQPDYESNTEMVPWIETVTDASGNYTAFVKPGVIYRVFFNTNYWNWETQAQVKVDGLSGFATDAVNFSVKGDPLTAKLHTFADTTTVNAMLSAGLTIHGVVSASTGTPIAGVQVRLQPEWDPETGSSGSWGETVTDANGVYSFTAQPGTYRVEFATSYWNWETQQKVTLPGNWIGGFADGSGAITNDWAGAKTFQVNDTLQINAQLMAGMTLSGTVTTVDGTLVKGAEVSVHSADWSAFFPAKTNDQGQFSVSVTPGADYQVEVWPAYCAAGNLNEAEGCGPSHVAFLGGNWMTPPGSAWVSGWLVDDSTTKPVVVASGLAVEAVVVGSVLSQSDPHLVTNLRVDRSLTIAIQVDMGSPLHGRVVDVDGNGVPYAWIESELASGPADQEGFFVLNMPSSANVTQANSSFAVNVFPGGYEDPTTHAWVQSTNFIGGVVSGSADTSFSLVANETLATKFAADLVTINETQVAWPTMDLGNSLTGLLVEVSRGTAIVGTVLDGDNQGIANLWLNGWSAETSQGSGTTTRSDGAYSLLVPTPAADVTVWYQVELSGGHYLSPAPVLVKVESQGVVGVYAIDKTKSVADANGIFKAVAGEAILADPRGGVPVNFTLTTGNTISGRVTDSANKGVAWSWVDIHTKDGTKWYGANTDENGYYSVSVAPANNYVGVVWGWAGQYQTTFYKNATNEEGATLIDASGTTSPTNINFMMSAGAKVSGTIAGLSSGKKLWLNLWSESAMAWGGTEVTGTATGAATFSISGLASAKDYRLDWRANSDEIPSGFYAGVPGSGVASGPKGWEQATQLSTLNGNVTGVAIDLAAVNTKNLTVKIGGLTVGAKVDADARSDTLNAGRWKQATADANGEATIVLKGLDATGSDYRLFIGGPNAAFKTGNFKGEVNATALPTTAGTIVGWDRATLIDMSTDQYAYVMVGSGRKLTVTVAGLQSGQKAWVDAFSETTYAWGGGEVAYVNGTTDSVVIKGLEAADDYQVSIWGAKIKGGSYAGEGLAPGSWETAETVDLSSADKGISMLVSSGRSISGTVSGLTKSQGAWVDAWSNSTFSWGGNSVSAAGSGSDAYSIAGVSQATDFTVSFSSEGYVPQKQSNVNTSAADVTGVNFTASTGGSIKGSITGLKAYERVWIDAWSPLTDQFVGNGAKADASGAATYTVTGVPAASDYVVGLWRGNKGLFYTTSGVTPVWDNHSKVTVTGSAATSSINFDLAAAGTLFYNLSGAVTGLTADQIVEINAWSATGGAQTTVTGNATYTLEGLPAGSYTVEVFSNGYVPQRTKSVTVAANKVTAITWTTGWNDMGSVAIAGNTTGLDIALSAGYSIQGSVTSGGTAVSGAWVQAWSDTSNIGGGALTNSKGAFTIKGLQGGSVTYKVDVWTPSGTASSSVTVTTANQTGVSLAITKAAGTITGTVTTSTSSAAAGALVLAYDSTGAEKKRSVASTSGVYTLDGLTSDAVYTVKVFSASKAKAGTWSTITSDYASSNSVTASSPATTLNLTLN